MLQPTWIVLPFKIGSQTESSWMNGRSLVTRFRRWNNQYDDNPSTHINSVEPNIMTTYSHVFKPSLPRNSVWFFNKILDNQFYVVCEFLCKKACKFMKKRIFKHKKSWWLNVISNKSRKKRTLSKHKVSVSNILEHSRLKTMHFSLSSKLHIKRENVHANY